MTNPTFIVTAHVPGEIWQLPGGAKLEGVHSGKECEGPCVMHNPSPHHMSEWPLLWRYDRHIFERICEHGVGHPDPDQFDYWASIGKDSESVHGCDGCCVPVDLGLGGRDLTHLMDDDDDDICPECGGKGGWMSRADNADVEMCDYCRGTGRIRV